MTLRSIVVVGAGVAGLTTVRTLRDEGFAGGVLGWNTVRAFADSVPTSAGTWPTSKPRE
jgi:cation diffusion facilitator CzcD-associated flavoprotein CzcO